MSGSGTAASRARIAEAQTAGGRTSGGRPRADSGDVRVDFFTSHEHYVDHLLPVWTALGAHQGEWYKRRPPPPGPRLTVVAAYGNLMLVRQSGRRVAYTEHGAGFTYEGGGNPFAGGRDRAGVELFLDINRRVRTANSATHPDIPGMVVGTPKLDEVFLRAPKPRSERPVVAVSFHWDYRKVPETRWAYPHYRRVLGDVAKAASREGIELVGHGHPRAQVHLRQAWRRAGMRFLPKFEQVLDEADLYVVDTSSTAYEFAATGRPVLLLNAPWYRRDVRHGLRFWEHLPGLVVDEPGDLLGGIRVALGDPPQFRRQRESAVEVVYPVRDGSSARRAAEALVARARELEAR